ncbi:site-specific recombinase XerD [Krasilnikovia cinnamomea]|uniref:Site-specific recombinase XerD n=1 Tax=Krasilnikovia cinnamomea TaxID=349313 RepID=A0A4Q7Z9N7_9ACTN|nr:tyrosine-type recombinase/integrase [Krasilnikovia cinnamomea]RZU46595.1 site-specific recombinase XerD [Krasilnikovia cinnamomea]
MLVLPSVGRVAEDQAGLPWLVMFPDGIVHEAAAGWFRELLIGDCSPATLRSYGYDLLRWFRWLYAVEVDWARAARDQVRDFVFYLREAPGPMRGASPVGFAPRTINHQLAVLSGFYDYVISCGHGPLVNPVPPASPQSRRVLEHHDPSRPWPVRRRADYRQRVPRQIPRALPDDAADALFSALRSHRDRALVAFWLSSGVRAAELLGLRHDRVDYGRRTIAVVSKGTRVVEQVPASADAFVWLSLHLAEGYLGSGADPVWWTLRAPRRPLTYHAARAVLIRAQAALGTRWRLHDLRHTAAMRMAADPGFTLVDVQAVLRHAHVSTTELYLQPRTDDLVEKMEQLRQRRLAAATQPPAVAAGYDQAAVRELLGLDR